MSVEDALVTALNDGAITGGDVTFARRMAETDMTPRQRSAVWRMLGRYGIETPEPDATTVGTRRNGLAPPRSGVVMTRVATGVAIEAPYRLKETIKALPSRTWDQTTKRWIIPAVPAVVDLALRALPGAEADDEVIAIANEMRSVRVDPTSPEAADLPPIPIVATEPWPHQLAAYHFSIGREATLLAMGMGVGKTKVSIDLMVNANAQQVLILAPKNVVGVWPREFEIHAPGRYHVTALRTTDGSVAKRTERADGILAECRCGRPHAFAVNYEAAALDPFARWALAQSWDYVVFDESHRIKAPTGKRSKFAGKLRATAKHRLALSGTPMAQSPLDVWGQFRALDPTIFGPSFHSFKHRYAIMGGWQGKQVVGMNPVMEEELSRLYKSVAFEVDSSVLDLPEPVHVTRSVPLGRKARKVYDALASDMYAEIGSGEVTIQNVLVKILRLAQVTGGLVTDDEGETHEVDSGKEDLLVDVLEDIDVASQPVVVFARFVHDLDVIRRVAEGLGYRVGELSGRSHDLTGDAKMPADIDVLAVQIQSGGVGIDLTRAKVGIYYSVGYGLADYEQSLKRLDRPGQTGSVTFVHLTCEGTIDEDIYTALAERQEVIDRVLAAAQIIQESSSLT